MLGTEWLPSSTYPRPGCWHSVDSHWLRASVAGSWAREPSGRRHPLKPRSVASASAHAFVLGGKQSEPSHTAADEKGTSELLLCPCSRRQASLNTALLWALELASAWEINTVPFKAEGLCLAELNSGDCHPGNESLGDLHLMHHNRGRAFQQVRRVQRP